jgi:hypothetical protein
MEHVPRLLREIDTGDKIIYRGHADADWVLKPSIGRHFNGPWEYVQEWEINSLDEFKKRSVPYIKVKPNSDIEWLCLMQHHGCATRLLDFTTNPLIALFFASDPAITNEGEIIIAKYGRSYQSVSNDNLFERSNSFAYHPPHITERIIGQSGCFVYSNKPNTPLNNKQISRIPVSKKYKVAIREELKQIGISYSSLFPGIDGICQDLNDQLILELQSEVPF